MSPKTPLVSVTVSEEVLYVPTVLPTVGPYGLVVMRYSLNHLTLRCEDSETDRGCSGAACGARDPDPESARASQYHPTLRTG